MINVLKVTFVDYIRNFDTSKDLSIFFFVKLKQFLQNYDCLGFVIWMDFALCMNWKNSRVIIKPDPDLDYFVKNKVEINKIVSNRNRANIQISIVNIF